MTGRAGRLGRVSKDESRVFILLPYGTAPFDVIARYYKTDQGIESQIYVEDDKQPQTDIEQNPFVELAGKGKPCALYSSLGPLDFTYPFVRSVLDALRHLNSASAPSLEIKRPVTLSDMEQMFVRTLYAAQKLYGSGGQQKERELFSCAMYRTLEGCADEPLYLVQVDVGDEHRYTITPRGEAIVDTGTELDTVEPLLRILNSIWRIWAEETSSSFPIGT